MITKQLFASIPECDNIYVFHIENENKEYVELINYGASVRRMKVINGHNKLQDVVLGYDSLNEYINNDGCFGATIGRYANRIKGACFNIRDSYYELSRNERNNTLHGGKCGFDKRIWNYEIVDEASVKFTYFSPDKEEGFPADMLVCVTYTFKDSSLLIKYEAKTNAATYINLTNHIYFNLCSIPSVTSHLLKLYSQEYTPTDSEMIPTGKILPLKDTPFDFSDFHTIGEYIDCKELKKTCGYDCNYVLNKNNSDLAAELVSNESKLRLRCFTTQPALMLYTGNHISVRKGLNNVIYEKYAGVCLETQHFPDSMHHPQFPSVLLLPNEVFKQSTEYSFERL